MRIAFCIPYFLLLLLASSCHTVSKSYNPNRKYSPEQLREDYRVFQEILAEKHPSLYWYQPEDSIRNRFAFYQAMIRDSMTETAFAWQVLAPMTRHIQCGHTTVMRSHAYQQWARGKRFASFPLYLKVWNDTMAVTGNLYRQDSLFRRGTLISSINGIRTPELYRQMLQYLPADGRAENLNQYRLSSNFPYYHRAIFGLSKTYAVQYLDSNNREKTVIIPMFHIPADSLAADSTKRKVKKENKPTPPPRPNRAERLKEYREWMIDSSGMYAVMSVYSFTGGHLRSFYRRSFRALRKKRIPNLVVDVRENGGGHISKSTLLTRYLTRSRFKVADTVIAQARSLGKKSRYIKSSWLYNPGMWLMASRRKDGMYHVRYLEKKWYGPKKKNHYNGQVYLLTSGHTFSAAALFCHALKGQPGILLAGEETGGGNYGNNGVLLPEMVLPNTGVRVRLPLYRLVQHRPGVQDGRGVQPDIPIGPNLQALIQRRDKKMETIRNLILNGFTTKNSPQGGVR